MFGVDVDQFRVLKPWRDPSFWVAVCYSAVLVVGALVPDAASWFEAHRAALTAAVAPVLVWLYTHGQARSGGARALGDAVASAVHAGPSVESNPPAGATPDQQDA